MRSVLLLRDRRYRITGLEVVARSVCGCYDGCEAKLSRSWGDKKGLDLVGQPVSE